MTKASCPASVLVVEDDHAIRETIGEILEDEGYETALAENGQHALEILGELPRPCLLLVDLIMPRMDGWELMSALSRDDRLATIPVVVLSAFPNVEAVPPYPLVKKPVDFQILLQIVREHCCGDRGPGHPAADRDPAPPGG